MSARRVCKDCLAEVSAIPNVSQERIRVLSTRRPAPEPGPRCVTHWRLEKKARAKRTHELRVVATYDLTTGQYDQLYEGQNGLCPICNKARGLKKRLAVDHDHETNEVRGLLCTRCNYDLLGWYDIPALKRAIAYLENPPARRILNTPNTPPAP